MLYVRESQGSHEFAVILGREELRESICGRILRGNPADSDLSSLHGLPKPVVVNIDVAELSA